MSARALVDTAESMGVALWVDGEEIVCDGPGTPEAAALLERIEERLDEVIALLRAAQPCPWAICDPLAAKLTSAGLSPTLADKIAERAGILEFDAGLARDDAEVRASLSETGCAWLAGCELVEGARVVVRA